MSCDAYYYTRRLQDDVEELRKELRRSFQEQADKIDAGQITMPDVAAAFQNSGDKESYRALDDKTALYFRRTGDNLIRMYELDFGLSMATISTIQGQTVTATETRKLSEMPPKMVQEAQKSLSGASAGDGTPSRHRLKRR